MMRTHLSITMLLATCGAQSGDVPLGQDFELKPGQAVTIAGTGQTVRFESVAEDSRCPAGVVCIWAGNARVILRAGVEGRDTSVAVNTGVEPRTVRVGKLTLELKAVTPEPRADTHSAPDSYRVTLRATAA